MVDTRPLLAWLAREETEEVILSLLSLLGCKDVIHVEVPRLPEGAASAIVVIDGGGVHAISAESIALGRPPLDRLPEDAPSVTLLPYPCALQDLGLEEGPQTEASDPAALKPLPEALDPQALALEAPEPFEWAPASEGAIAQARDRKLDLEFLRCPALSIPEPIEISTTSSAAAFAVLATASGWFVATSDGEYFEIAAGDQPGRLVPDATGPGVLGGAAIGETAFFYTTEGALLAGRLSDCFPGEACFETVADGGPLGRFAWIAGGPTEIFLVINDDILDQTIFVRAFGTRFQELSRWTLGAVRTEFAVFFGGVVQDGDQVLALDARNNNVVSWSARGLLVSPLPELGSAATAIANVPGYGTLVGNEFGTVLARSSGWGGLPKSDDGFLITQIRAIDDGLLLLGQTSMDQYHPDLGSCGFATGAFRPVYLAVPLPAKPPALETHVLVLSRLDGGTTLEIYLLERTNPRPACLRATTP